MVTQDKHGACAALVAAHEASVKGNWTPDKPIDTQTAEHLRAWKRPTKGGERAVKLAIEAYAAYADDYYDSFERELGTDGYFSGYARDMLLAINASLTMGFKSRLDSGCVHRLLIKLAEISGVEWEESER